MEVEYCRFKIYNEGQVCSEFEVAKNYDYFTTGTEAK